MPLTRIREGGGRDKRNLVDLQFFRNFNMKKKDIVSREAERQFLALLRAGLWGGKADMACFPESGLPDWKGILYLGRSQAVLPLIYDGMLTLPEEMRLHGPALMRLIAYVDRIEGLNRELDEASAEISARLAAEGIRSVLLKGQGLAVLYRIPGHRQCGDIDLYVGEENYRKAINIIRNWNEIHNEQPEMTKHTCFEFKNVELEIHKRCLDIHELRVSKHYIILEKNELCKNDCLFYLSDSKIPVYVPPIEFNLFYVFFHAFNHFAECCILTVQMRRVFHHDEELRTCTVRIGGACHREDAAGMTQIIFKTVCRKLSLYGISGATHTCSRGVPSLDHEASYNSVENDSVIKALLYKAHKVVYCIGSYIGVELRSHHISVFHLNSNYRIFLFHRLSP